MVVLPTPGGPQKMSDDSAPEDSMTVSGASGPRTCDCPMTSASFCGRKRSARGRGPVSCSEEVEAKRSPILETQHNAAVAAHRAYGRATPRFGQDRRGLRRGFDVLTVDPLQHVATAQANTAANLAFVQNHHTI